MCSPGYACLYLWISAVPPEPVTWETEYVASRTRWPLTIEYAYRSSARTGGPAIRFPSVSYCPPWHGQPKPDGFDGISVTSRNCFSCFMKSSPFGCTGHPRCAQWFEMIVKLGRPFSSPLLRTKAVRLDTSPSFGLDMNVATT